MDNNFEKKMWDSLSLLRGTLNIAEYKDIVLGLIFLRAFADLNSSLIDWSKFQNMPLNLGEQLNLAMAKIEDYEPKLSGILPKNYDRPELAYSLTRIVDAISQIDLSSKREQDLLGRAYEYCLGKFAELEGKLAGEFYTPKSIVQTLVEILRPFGKIYDPCCGSGGIFIQSAKFLHKIDSSMNRLNALKIYGQDSNSTTWKLAQMNLAMHGLNYDLGKSASNTFLEDQHPNLKADFVMANPPFNLSHWGKLDKEELADDPRWQYGTPPISNANFAWMQHILYHLNASGSAGLVLTNGSLTARTNNEGLIRQNIIEAGLLDCIIVLPTNLFYTTAIPVSLWFLSKKEQPSYKTLLIDARHFGRIVARKRKELSPEEISQLAAIYREFKAGTLENEIGFYAVVTKEDLAKNNYLLTPSRYTGTETRPPLSKQEFQEKFTAMSQDLATLFYKSQALDQQILQVCQDFLQE